MIKLSSFGKLEPTVRLIEVTSCAPLESWTSKFICIEPGLKLTNTC